MRDSSEIVRSDAVELIRHELNAPVATALLYVSIAENYASRLPVDVITPALRVVRSEIQRLKSLIDRMTELQRSGRPSLQAQFIDIGGTVRATVKRLLTTFSGTESVAITLPPHAVHGWWDQTAVEQIVSNLLSNALKFGQGRSIRLVVKATTAGASISVRDQGVGIAAADRMRIFERHEHAGRRGRRGQRPRPLVGARADPGSRRPRDGAEPEGPRHHVHGDAAAAALPSSAARGRSSSACRLSAARCGPSPTRRHAAQFPPY